MSKPRAAERRARPRMHVLVVPATLAIASEASANPPPPKSLPDPPLVAPAKAEAPSVVRKHANLCFAFYPSGGTLAIDCPKELLTEPLGEGLIKQPSGRCQFAPFTSGSPGRIGYIESCPSPPFGVVAEPGVIPEWSKKLAIERRSTTPVDDSMPSPLPARVDTTEPQAVGCNIAKAPSPAMTLIPFVAGALALATRRTRTRTGRARTPPAVSTDRRPTTDDRQPKTNSQRPTTKKC